MSRAQGVTDAELRALSNYGDSDLFDARDRTVLDYATAMTATPVDVPDALFDRLRQVLDERQIVELTAAIAWENYRARVNHALGMEAEGFSEGAFCPIPARPALANGPGDRLPPTAPGPRATSSSCPPAAR